MTSTSQPAGRLLVFTLGARAEAERHPLVPERLRTAEVELREACLESVIAAGNEAGLRVEVSSPRPLALGGVAAWHGQEGPTFGDRLRSAVRTAFERAPSQPLVVVGSDSPGLQATQLIEAARALEGDPDRVVLGPSRDGGFYLLAAARPLDDVLAAVTWCGRATLDTLTRALARAGRPVVMLSPLDDLDEPEDLARWLALRTACRPRLVLSAFTLRRLLAWLCRPSSMAGRARPLRRLPERRLGRAPPQLAAR